MSVCCDLCGVAHAAPRAGSYTRCSTESCNGKVILSPIEIGKMYIRFGKGRYRRVSVDELLAIHEDEDCWYIIDDTIVEIRNQQEVYGTVQVEGVVKNRLAELEKSRQELENVKEQLAAREKTIEEKDDKLAAREKVLDNVKTLHQKTMKNLRSANVELEEVRQECEETEEMLEEAKINIDAKDEALQQVKGELQDTKAALAVQKRLQGQIKEETTVLEKREARREEEFNRVRKELEVAETRIRKMIGEKADMTKEIEGLQESLAEANKRAEDLNTIASFRKDQCSIAEKSLAEKEAAFSEYKEAAEKEKKELSKIHDEKIADLEQTQQRKEKMKKAEAGKMKLNESCLMEGEEEA